MLALRWGESEVRWPLTPLAAGAALRILLAPDDPGARQELAVALARDAPLAGWMLVQARRRGAPLPDSIRALALWIAEAGPAVWVGIERYALPDDRRAAWRRTSAACDLPEMDVDSSRHLAALVRHLPAPGTDPRRDDPTEDLAADSPPPFDEHLAVLPELISRLARLADLEARFAPTLEAEKLAALGELAAGAGHEINNPLGVITGRAELLLRGEQHAERRHDLAVIHTQALRVRTLISDMMLFARPPAPRPALADLSLLAGQVVVEMQPLAESRQISLQFTDPRQPNIASVDAPQIEIALRALLDNSLEATPAGGAVRVHVESGASHLRIVVADSGRGIPPEVRRHLFDPFYSGRQAGRGLGFGLAKCWRIVTAHGGSIAVESEPGHGATFAIELPRPLEPWPAIEDGR